jgi:hypothetical protein
MVVIRRRRIALRLRSANMDAAHPFVNLKRPRNKSRKAKTAGHY